MRTVLAVLVTLATATAGPATRPAPTSMTVDELRREVVRLRAENDELQRRLDRLEAPADGEPDRLPVSEAIRRGVVQPGMTLSQARAAAKGATETLERDGSKRTYVWTWSEMKVEAFFKSNADRLAWQQSNPTQARKFTPTTVGRTVITRRVVAVVDRGRVIEVSDTGRKADQ